LQAQASRHSPLTSAGTGFSSLNHLLLLPSVRSATALLLLPPMSTSLLMSSSVTCQSRQRVVQPLLKASRPAIFLGKRLPPNTSQTHEKDSERGVFRNERVAP